MDHFEKFVVLTKEENILFRNAEILTKFYYFFAGSFTPLVQFALFYPEIKEKPSLVRMIFFGKPKGNEDRRLRAYVFTFEVFDRVSVSGHGGRHRSLSTGAIGGGAADA